MKLNLFKLPNMKIEHIKKIIETLTTTEPIVAEEFNNDAHCYYCGASSGSLMDYNVKHTKDCIISLAHDIKLTNLKLRLNNAREQKISSEIDEATIALNNYLESRNL